MGDGVRYKTRVERKRMKASHFTVHTKTNLSIKHYIKHGKTRVIFPPRRLGLMPYVVGAAPRSASPSVALLPVSSLSLAEGARLHEAQVLLGDDHVHVLLAQRRLAA